MSSFPQLRKEWKEWVCSIFPQSLCPKDIISQFSLALTFQEVASPFPLVCHNLFLTTTPSFQGFPELVRAAVCVIQSFLRTWWDEFVALGCSTWPQGLLLEVSAKKTLSLRVAHSSLVRVDIALHLKSELLY